MAERFDVVVIGAGPGGARAARRCAQRGASVALVERQFIGGTCRTGAASVKDALASAHLLMKARSASEMGIDIPSAAPNWPRIQQRRESIITGLRKGMQGGMKSAKIAYFEGTAVVHSPTKVTVEANGQKTDLDAGKLILATGSESIQIPSLPFDGKVVISSTEALSLPEIPKSMVVVGGGVIGCELGCAYAAMGTQGHDRRAAESPLRLDSWASRLVEREPAPGSRRQGKR